jgi:DNA-binding transcriptional regulator YiaG/uncharacterized DUF497 family protein
MEFEWDDAKGRETLDRRGFDFKFAAQVFNDPRRIDRRDVRRHYTTARNGGKPSDGSARRSILSSIRCETALFASFRHGRLMTMRKKITGSRLVRARLIDGKLYGVLPGGRLGEELKPRVDHAKLNSPAASEPDEDTPLLTMRQLRQFKRVDPPNAAPHSAPKSRRRGTARCAAFAAVFNLSVATVRDWESLRRTPDGPARVLLRVIAREPKAVMRALD